MVTSRDIFTNTVLLITVSNKRWVDGPLSNLGYCLRVYD